MKSRNDGISRITFGAAAAVVAAALSGVPADANPVPQKTTAKPEATAQESNDKSKMKESRESKPQGDILIDPEALERERMRQNLEWETLEERRKKSGGGLKAYLHDELKYCGYYQTQEGPRAGFRVRTEIGLLFGKVNAPIWNGRLVDITPEYVTVSIKTRPSDKKETMVKIKREVRKPRSEKNQTTPKTPN